MGVALYGPEWVAAHPRFFLSIVNFETSRLSIFIAHSEDFTKQEWIRLQYELEIFEVEKTKCIKLKGVSTIYNLRKSLCKLRNLRRTM